MKNHYYRLMICLVFLFWIFTWLPIPVPSQTIKGAFRYKRSPEQLEEFLRKLEKGSLTEIPKLFYGEKEVFDDNLPDLVVFIDKRCVDPEIRFDLVKGAKQKDYLLGEQYIYVMVFIAQYTHDTQNPPLSVKMATLDQRMGSGEFALFSVLNMVASALSGAGLAEKEKKASSPVEPASLKLHNMGSHNGTRLSFGQAKMALSENTFNRITILGLPEKVPLASFGNYSGSRITSSLGFNRTSYNSESPASVEPFIFGHFYLRRPALPQPHYSSSWKEFCKKLSFSLVTGTRLSGKLFDGLFLGFSLGHFMGPIGIVGGCNFRIEHDPEKNTKYRKRYFSIGLTFIL